ncbi:hypothetical protein FOVSG1_006635 [Fusarium oxysporum f. sp. vasinfectum]
MGYPTDATSWPKATPSSVIQLIDLHFSLLDTKSETIGERLAGEVFTEHGIFMAANGTFEGRDAITTCRKGAWGNVISRRHQVNKAFLNDRDADALDLILVGAVDVEMADGAKHRHEFVTRSVVVGADSGNPRVQHYQVLIPTPRTSQKA